MRTRTLFYAAAAVGLIWQGVGMVQPDRNVHGNPSMEALLSECQTPSGARFRLYRGEAGATVAFWYSVTAQPLPSSTERQIFFSYSKPVATEIVCGPSSLEIDTEGGKYLAAEADVSNLVQRPMVFLRGQLQPSKSRPSITTSQGFGAAFLVLAGLLVWRAGANLRVSSANAA
jgi:hypothetical protein